MICVEKPCFPNLKRSWCASRATKEIEHFGSERKSNQLMDTHHPLPKTGALPDEVTAAPILVVALDRALRTLLSFALEQGTSRRVLLARGPEEALRLLAISFPCLVLLDTDLPELSDLYKRIVTSHACVDIPIVVMGPDVPEEVRVHPSCLYLGTFFDLKELLALIHHFVP